jgi:protein-L-isoaspartate(D-aspartate) O-methyltransferase
MSRGSSERSSTDAFAEQRALMVEGQLRARGCKNESVLQAMGEVPRELFVAESERAKAYHDGALPIGDGQTISQPWIVASMAAHLDLQGPERVLEVGTGSGYSAAVLSRLCSHVVTIERHEPLAAKARETLAALGIRNVEIRTGDGSRGVPDRAPFDGILVTAAADGRPPQALFDQLAPGAPLVCPIERRTHERLVVVRDGIERTIAPVRFVPLVEGGN